MNKLNFHQTIFLFIIQDNMIIQVVFFIIVLSLLTFYFIYYQPKRDIQKYAKYAESLGYKVKLMPFKFMEYYLIKLLKQDEGSLKIFKQQLNKYDLVVGNMFTKLAILPVNTIILKDVFNQLNKLPKNPFISEVFQLFKGGGIVFTEGEDWKKKRRIISSAFHYDFLNDMIPIIITQSNNSFKQIDQNIKNKQNVNLLKSFQKILSNVVVKCFFGMDLSQYKIMDKTYCEYFVQLLNELNNYVGSVEHMLFGLKLYKLGLTSQSRNIRRKISILVTIAREVTQKQLDKIKRNQQVNKNLLTMLYQNGLLSQNSDDSNKYTLDELIGEFFAFFAAGTDTTSNAANLALHYLSQNSDCLRKAQNQLQSIYGNSQLGENDKIKSMKYIQAVFHETLRIGGPASGLFPRISTQNIVVGGIELPKGTSISLFPLLNHHKSQIFTDPSCFNPQRWLQSTVNQPYTFLPFGGGQRNCLGQHLAKIQAKILISAIIRRYQFKALNPIKMKAQFIYSTIYGHFQMKLKIPKL